MKAQLEAVFQALTDAVFVFDLSGHLVRTNQAAAVSHGYRSAKELPQCLEEFADSFTVTTLEGDRLPLSEWPISRIIRGEQVSGLILRVNRNDGRSWIYNYSGNPALDDDGKPKLAVIVVRDMTEQMRMMEDLRHSENQLDLVINSVPMLISYIDKEYRYRFVNRTYEEWMKRPLDQILNCPAEEVLGEAAFRTLKDKFDRALAGERVSFDQEIVYRDGIPRVIHASYNPDKDQNGQVRGFVVSVADLTELKRTERNLVASEERFRKIAESLPQLVWTATAEGQVDYYNGRIALYREIDQVDELWSWEPLVHSEDLQRTAEAWNMAVATKTDYQCEHRILMRDGEYHWHLSRATPLVDKNGVLQRWFGTATDIHEQKRVQAELVAAKEEAERANRLKSAFLTNMSHEIRTPLGAILGFTDLMRDPTLSTRERENFARIVNRNGEQLSTIINDILDLSKVEAGHLALEFAQTNPSEIVADVATLLQINADVKGLRLQFSSDPTTPATLVTDPARLRQILLNVIGNAIKFTTSGSVRVRSYGEDPCVFFEVIDTGIGIPESARERIFEAFVQADVTLSRKFGGTGLGLALSRQLARSLGGDVKITDTAVGRGTRFLISVANKPEKLPDNGIDSTLRVVDSTHQNKDLLRGMRALVVDDSEDNRMLIGHFLNGYGAQVDFATNGLEGCRKALNGSFDVVLMDIQMPEMDGYTATMKLRESGYNKPIVALTAHAMGEARQKCLHVGCSDHLTKPINVKELVATVGRFAPKPFFQQ